MNMCILVGTVRGLSDFWSFFQSRVLPLYSFVVRLQSLTAFGVAVCALLFSTSAFFEEAIHCVERGTALFIQSKYLPVCLKYAKAAGYGDDAGPVSHLYTWVVAGLLLVSNFLVLCLTPLSVKAILLEDGGEVRNRLDISSGLKDHIGKFRRIYIPAILVDVMALMSHGLAFVVVNTPLLNRQVLEVMQAFPWERDMLTFTDAVSLAFPSFLCCDIDHEAHLVGIRSRYYGCFHKEATLYVAAFMLTGVLVVHLSLLTFLHLLYLLTFLPTTCGRRQLVTSGCDYGPERHFECQFSPGDLMVLEISKAYLDGRQYEDFFTYLQSETRGRWVVGADQTHTLIKVQSR